jgi:hypothetical protein
MLLLTSPRIAARSCESCLRWQYDEGTGEVAMRAGRKLPRRGPTPCRTPTGCPKGTPEAPKTLTLKNLMAYRHYQQCKATGQFPDDPIVRHNAGIIRQIEDAVERAERIVAGQLSAMTKT